MENLIIIGCLILVLVILGCGKEFWTGTLSPPPPGPSTILIVKTYTNTAGTPRITFGEYTLVPPVERRGNTYKFVLPIPPVMLNQPVFLLSDNSPESIYVPTANRYLTKVGECKNAANGSTALNTSSFMCAYL